MNNNKKNEFIELNQSLISAIKKALDIARKQPQLESDFLWKRPSTFEKNVLPNLTSLFNTYKSNIIMLAKFQVGLSKYFDFYSLNWTTERNKEAINSIVAQIVNLAFQIIQPYLKQTTQPVTRCGCHDNACIKDVLGPRYNGPNLNHYSSSGLWPTLLADHAKQFLRKPKARILGKNSHVYRIVGPKNNPYGSWWLLDYRIDSRSFWREKFAVLETWNSDEQYVDFFVPEEDGIKVWMGKAACQQVTKNCILPGGYVQVWIDPNIILKLKSYIDPAKQISWPFNTIN